MWSADEGCILLAQWVRRVEKIVKIIAKPQKTSCVRSQIYVQFTVRNKMCTIRSE
jgi:hypothetical protein